MNMRAIVPTTRDIGRITQPISSPPHTLPREVDRLFDDFSRGTRPVDSAAARFLPSMDVSETDKEIELAIELPGLSQKDVDISVTDNVLTVRGEKKAET